MFKDSRLWTYPCVFNSKNQLVDGGFLGIKNFLPSASLPYKQSKKHKLTKEEKIYNKQLAKQRIKIENINRECKIFRIVKEQRRQKQTKHNLFWNLIAGLVNFKKSN